MKVSVSSVENQSMRLPMVLPNQLEFDYMYVAISTTLTEEGDETIQEDLCHVQHSGVTSGVTKKELKSVFFMSLKKAFLLHHLDAKVSFFGPIIPCVEIEKVEETQGMKYKSSIMGLLKK